MNGSQLNRIAKLLEGDALPEWVRAYLETNREQVAAQLDAGEDVEITGPTGQGVRLRPAA